MNCWQKTACIHVSVVFWSYHLNVSAETDKATFCQSSLVQFWPACMNCPCSFLAPSVVFFAAIAHFFQGWIRCASGDTLLHTLVATSAYLSYYCLIISSYSSGHSLLSSGINETFFPWGILPTEYFLFFRRFSVNHMQENRSPLSEIVRLAHLAPITIESRLNHSLHDTRQGSQLLEAPCHLGDPKGWQTLNFCLNLMTNRSRMC